jgi:hypothetical protein
VETSPLPGTGPTAPRVPVERVSPLGASSVVYPPRDVVPRAARSFGEISMAKGFLGRLEFDEALIVFSEWFEKLSAEQQQAARLITAPRSGVEH